MSVNANVSRRELVAGAAAAAAAGSVGITAGARPLLAVEAPQAWDEETDVVVVGYGGAGAAAAYEARKAGAEVIILEKRDIAGGSTNICGGLCYIGGGTPLQQACGFEDTPDNYYNFLVAAGGPGVSEAHCRVMADKGVELYDWLVNEIGVIFNDGYNPAWPEEENYAAGLSCTGDEAHHDYDGIATFAPHSHWVVGFETPDGSLTGSRNGTGLFQPIEAALEGLGPDVRLETPATNLVYDVASNRVLGVVAQHGDEVSYIKARKAVVLTAGGFGKNEDMIDQYVPYAKGSFVIGTEGDTGDGIRMGQGVGAGIKHMNFAYGEPSLGSWMHVNSSTIGGPALYGALVSARGQRFMAEDHYAGSFYAQMMRNPNYYSDYNPAYMIVDDETFAQMNEVSEVREGLVAAEGETFGELAKALGMPEGALEATMAYYNEHAAEGRDPVWKKQEQWVRPIAQPPFRALVFHCLNGLFTFGGMTIDTETHVLAALDGQPIGGLYAAGRTASDILGTGYQGSGGSVGSCFTFGRIAGQNAAAEQAWG